MQKEHPILFSTLMVQAILAGRKTNTRRLTKLQEINKHPDWWECIPVKNMAGELAYMFTDKESGKVVFIKSPYGQPGDMLWARESQQWLEGFAGSGYYVFKADFTQQNGAWEQDIKVDGKDRVERVEKWRPSIHMPKEASRIWLPVEDVRVERLQDISEEDAIAEGVQENVCDPETADRCPSLLCIDGCSGKGQYYRYPVDFDDLPCYSARESFQTLWHSINGRESWNANPWVWAVKFKVLSTTGHPAIAEQEAAAV